MHPGPSIVSDTQMTVTSETLTKANSRSTSYLGSLNTVDLTPVPSPHRKGSLQAIAAEHFDCPIIDFRDLVVKRKIGDGSIGQVYLGKWQETDVAIKVPS